MLPIHQGAILPWFLRVLKWAASLSHVALSLSVYDTKISNAIAFSSTVVHSQVNSIQEKRLFVTSNLNFFSHWDGWRVVQASHRGADCFVSSALRRELSEHAQF